MLGTWKRPLGFALGLGLATILSASAAPTVAQPGALNYVEGQARIGDQVVTSKSVGSAALNAGDVLSTGNGRAEILLTPGIFMRVGKNSAVRMDSPELTNTRVEVLRGEAMVEADLLHDEDHVMVGELGALTALEKKGVYSFDADNATVRVYDGKAKVLEADQHVELKKGKEAPVEQPLQSQKFDRDAAEASYPLYSWSKLRSEYLAEATAATAQTYVVAGGGWYGPGWYWNPYWSMYSFVPGDGFFYNPFGWGLYSPVYFYNAPVYPRFYGRSYVGGSRAIVPPAGRFRGGSVARGTQAPVMRSAPVPMMRSPSPMMGGGRRR
jgi:hypothetical protein